MNAELYAAILRLAEALIKVGGLFGEAARRKIKAVNANSDLAILVQVAGDLELIARQLDATEAAWEMEQAVCRSLEQGEQWTS